MSGTFFLVLLSVTGCDISGEVNELLGLESEVVAACEDLSDLDECSSCCTDFDDKYTGGGVEFETTCECLFPADD